MLRPTFAGSLSLVLFILPHFPSRVAADEFPHDLVRWVRDPQVPVFQGTGSATWDRAIRERGWILIENETYHLFYTGYDGTRTSPRLLGHATSGDGVIWTRDPANPLLSGSWVEDLCVVKRDREFLMFAEGERDVAHRLASSDLRRWTEGGSLDIRGTDGSPIALGARGTPVVLVVDGVWNLFYERGDQGVWLARSGDGVLWTNVQDDPVLPMGPEPYDAHAVAINQVFERDGYYYALYHANATRPWRDWTTCIARSRDLVRWEKYPGNPILKENRSSAILVTGPDGRSHLYTMHPEVVRYSNPATVPQR
jgi:hypothetical protein